MRKIQNHKYVEILKVLNVYEFGRTFEGGTRSEMAINNPQIKVNIKILKHLIFINFLLTSFLGYGNCTYHRPRLSLESISLGSRKRILPEFIWGAMFDSPVKSPSAVMPDFIRHPEPLEFTGFRLSPE